MGSNAAIGAQHYMTYSSGFAVENSRCVMSTWAVRWSAQGLGPIRLVALFKQSCDLLVGKAVSLM